MKVKWIVAPDVVVVPSSSSNEANDVAAAAWDDGAPEGANE
jgi:hypothetical protein